MKQGKIPVYYTRCPVPTATGIALQKGFFDELFLETDYDFLNIKALGAKHADAHYTHSIDHFFREGGGSPPIWARAQGIENQLLGVTFMEELLGIFVRIDDSAKTVADLAGRRIALPVWPNLVFNFWRFAAEKGFHSALKVHGMDESDVVSVDIGEDIDPHKKRNPGPRGWGDAGCDYHGQLQALLSGKVDAIFAKGSEAASLQREAGGEIRLLYDVSYSRDMNDRVNNSTPRLVTTSKQLVTDHPEVVIRYMQGILRAANWAPLNAKETRDIVAFECGIGESEVEHCFQPDYPQKFLPSLTPELLGSVEVMKSFLYQRGYLASDFSVDGWVNPEPLKEAQIREAGQDDQWRGENASTMKAGV